MNRETSKSVSALIHDLLPEVATTEERIKPHQLYELSRSKNEIEFKNHLSTSIDGKIVRLGSFF